MSIDYDFLDSLAVVKPRPLVVRVVHVESGQVASEHEIPADMTGPELDHWTHYIEAVCGSEYTTEIPGWESAA